VKSKGTIVTQYSGNVEDFSARDH